MLYCKIKKKNNVVDWIFWKIKTCLASVSTGVSLVSLNLVWLYKIAIKANNLLFNNIKQLHHKCF